MTEQNLPEQPKSITPVYDLLVAKGLENEARRLISQNSRGNVNYHLGYYAAKLDGILELYNLQNISRKIREGVLDKGPEAKAHSMALYATSKILEEVFCSPSSLNHDQMNNIKNQLENLWIKNDN